MTRVLTASILGLGLCCWPAHSHAGTQGHAGVTVGVCALDRAPRPLAFPRLCASLRGELWFGRERDRDVGFGPFMGVSTTSFQYFGAASGVSLVLPLSPTYPFILSLAGAALSRSSGWSPAAEAWLFWGPSSYNFHAPYAMASGLLLGYQQSFGDERVSIASVAGQLDLELVAIPFIAAHQWLFGG